MTQGARGLRPKKRQRRLGPRDVLRLRQQELRQQREALPIAQHRREVIEAVRRSSVVIVEGETGSGKSTQLPQYVAEDLKDVNTGNLRIGITQPRCVRPH